MSVGRSCCNDDLLKWQEVWLGVRFSHFAHSAFPWRVSQFLRSMSIQAAQRRLLPLLFGPAASCNACAGRSLGLGAASSQLSPVDERLYSSVSAESRSEGQQWRKGDGRRSDNRDDRRSDGRRSGERSDNRALMRGALGGSETSQHIQSNLALANAPKKVFELIGDPRSGVADDVRSNAFGEITVDMLHHQLSNEVYWYKYEFSGNAMVESHRNARLSEHAKNTMYVLRAKDPERCDWVTLLRMLCFCAEGVMAKGLHACMHVLLCLCMHAGSMRHARICMHTCMCKEGYRMSQCFVSFVWHGMAWHGMAWHMRSMYVSPMQWHGAWRSLTQHRQTQDSVAWPSTAWHSMPKACAGGASLIGAGTWHVQVEH